MSIDGEIVISSFEVAGRAVTPNDCTGEIVIRFNNDGLGGIDVNGFSGAVGVAEFGGFTVSGTTTAGNFGAVTFPPFSVSGVAGSVSSLTISAFAVIGEAGPPAAGAISFPPFSVLGTTKEGMACRGELPISYFSVQGTCYQGVVCGGTIRFGMRVSGTTNEGRRCSGRVVVPFPSLSGSASVGSPGHGTCDFPPFSVVGSVVDTGEFSSPLAYDKDAVQ